MLFQFLATGNVILKASARSSSPAERERTVCSQAKDSVMLMLNGNLSKDYEMQSSGVSELLRISLYLCSIHNSRAIWVW